MNKSMCSKVEDLVAGTFSHEPRAARRVLVVDDEPLIRRLNAEVLVDSGYQVDLAEDGAVAWEALQVCRYDLLITDNNMPNVTGVELLKKLHAARLIVPVIMATATIPTEELALAPWLQPAATLLKPYTLGQLMGTVEGLMRTTAAALRQTD